MGRMLAFAVVMGFCVRAPRDYCGLLFSPGARSRFSGGSLHHFDVWHSDVDLALMRAPRQQDDFQFAGDPVR